ncbi:monovalent cation:proton antiporter-2 (CPA2) family protein [Sandaracinobacteroides saxicola]|uniref:Cation:proton antiporter n=1 Tax=Sandaracinobacteroides saxicola TaxID=2759707 RepID=A0A7G5IE95_9SPHN|nr:monovalent cation:proton antiporter-2 (CPA2) family protein [Sandaracinobacteroides saxicola]QMW21687.1 cation:proton antiporter [Sandaracinobacteroides saxicola]
MAGAAETGLLTDAVVYLAAAAAMVPLFTRARLGAVLGYLAGGVLIGPHVLGLIGDPASTLKFAEFGIVLLLFVIGLELKPSRLWSLRRDIFGLGTAQVLLCGAALTGVLLLLTSLSWQAALVVGLPLALSSTALVVQLLRERDQLNTPLGERVFSVLLLQDLAIVPLLTVVAALSRNPDPNAPEGWVQALYTVGALLGLVLAGRFVLNPMLRVIGTLGAREVFVVTALLTVLGSALLMASLGLSMALGAFVAGVMLADSSYRHELEADIEPFRGLLLGLFFLSVGMSLDLRVLWENVGLVLALVVALVLVKTAVMTGLARLFGSSWKEAFSTGLLLSQGGEFAFVVFGAATAGLLIAPGAASMFAAVVTLSMALTPPLLGLWRRWKARGVSSEGLALPEEAGEGAAIVVGYGRFGQIVTQMLHARGVEVTLIDVKPEQIERSNQFGWKVYYGDGFRVDVLRAAGAERAQLLVIAADGPWAPTRLLPIRDAFPQLEIVARAHDRRHYIDLRRADQELIVRELFLGAVEVGRMALRALGNDEEAVDAIEAEFRRRDAERLALQAATGDIMAGRDSVFRPGTSWTPEIALGEIPFAGVEAEKVS